MANDKGNKKDKEKQDQSQEIDELNNKYLRALADYQNLEKRMSGALEQARTQTRKAVITDFIEILDDLEKADVFVKDNGLKMIMDRFKKILENSGVQEIDVLDMEYDPYTAEAVEVVPAKEGHSGDMVVEIVRKGYKIGDDIIRPAQVKVSQ